MKEQLFILRNLSFFIQDFIRENETLTSPSFQIAISCRVGWTAPVENVIKCNFDSAYDVLSKESISGVICRDNVEFIMASAIFPHWHLADVSVAEALSCLQVIILAKDLGFAKVVIEGDSLTVIKKVCATTSDSSLLGLIIHAIREVSKGFESVVFCSVHPKANNTAHTLAREGRDNVVRYFGLKRPLQVQLQLLLWIGRILIAHSRFFAAPHVYMLHFSFCKLY
ncbi:hypothetical protein V6N12_032898 [Hibiscus sabdariffa]|uniref:RNase H type-1 domain-containing protein n=1 Tax=Hibiscus sabdariffa TaxID=183260 RepID=A0ABR2BBC4_9ROSI